MTTDITANLLYDKFVIFNEPAVPSEPDKPATQLQIAYDLKLVWVTYGGKGWGARFRIEVWTVHKPGFLGGLYDCQAGVGGHDPYPLLAQAAREIWPEGVNNNQS